jgi:hypothetical protein
MGGRGVALEVVERAFVAWRRHKLSGTEIPEELWEQAAAAARVHGVTATAKRLRLNQTRLKQRCEEQGRGFVELAASELPLAGESVVELEDAAGMRMRLVLRGVPVAAVTAAAKELWGAAR